MLICSALDQKYSFWANLVQKFKVLYLLLRCVTFAK